MLIKMMPHPDYWEWSHDVVVPEILNDPEDPESYDATGIDEVGDQRCSINGSPYLDAEGIGTVIRLLVQLARKHGCGDLEMVPCGLRRRKRR